MLGLNCKRHALTLSLHIDDEGLGGWSVYIGDTKGRTWFCALNPGGELVKGPLALHFAKYDMPNQIKCPVKSNALTSLPSDKALGSWAPTNILIKSRFWLPPSLLSLICFILRSEFFVTMHLARSLCSTVWEFLRVLLSNLNGARVC